MDFLKKMKEKLLHDNKGKEEPQGYGTGGSRALIYAHINLSSLTLMLSILNVL
jgi:hypothetical protein